MDEMMIQPVGEEFCQRLTQTLQTYKAGKKHLESRVISAENWWKLRNETEAQKDGVAASADFHAKSAWLHNVISSKHADAIEAYPEPNILPREESDKQEAKMLSSIVPVLMERAEYEQTYSDNAWQKGKTGTGVVKVIWDTSLENGLGDIAIERCDLLNVFWEPGKTDIQKSKYFFHTELRDNDELLEQYPQLEDKLKSNGFTAAKFLCDDTVSTDGKSTVIDCYYHKRVGGVQTVQYVQYVGDYVLYATENDPQYAQRGLYDHGLYPYVFDPLYPIEGSPCGYGYIDIAQNPQIQIDVMKTAFMKNTLAGATPRYFVRQAGAVNEDEFLDLRNPLVHVQGNLDEVSLRTIDYNPLSGNYINMLDSTISELRETTGNTETSTGSNTSGATAASAIAALQEASGKGSRDATKQSYRAYKKIVYLVIELIRQFYDVPRQFRITGSMGAEQYVTYSNAGIKMQPMLTVDGQQLMRKPVFDIKVEPQKKNAYTQMAQNELALQFYGAGMFNPQMSDQALTCLNMMEFDGKDPLMQSIAANGTMYQKLAQYQQMALALAQKYQPDLVPGLAQSITGAPMQTGEVSADMGAGSGEPKHVERARERAQEASQPGGGTA